MSHTAKITSIEPPGGAQKQNQTMEHTKPLRETPQLNTTRTSGNEGQREKKEHRGEHSTSPGTNREHNQRQKINDTQKTQQETEAPHKETAELKDPNQGEGNKRRIYRVTGPQESSAETSRRKSRDNEKEQRILRDEAQHETGTAGTQTERQRSRRDQTPRRGEERRSDVGERRTTKATLARKHRQSTRQHERTGEANTSTQGQATRRGEIEADQRTRRKAQQQNSWGSHRVEQAPPKRHRETQNRGRGRPKHQTKRCQETDVSPECTTTGNRHRNE